MTPERIMNILVNAGPSYLQTLSSQELKEIDEFLRIKDSEINFILKNRSTVRLRFSSLRG